MFQLRYSIHDFVHSLLKKYEIGKCSSLFLIYYGIFRIISEYFREPDIQLGYIYDLASMGSILSFVMFLSGAAMFYVVKKRWNQIYL